MIIDLAVRCRKEDDGKHRDVEGESESGKVVWKGRCTRA